MRHSILKLAFVMVISILSGGCAALGSFMNPYEDTPQCPMGDNGECISLPDAYKRETGGKKAPPKPAAEADKAATPCVVGDLACTSKQIDQVDVSSPTSYRGALYKRLEGLVNEPRMPLVAPPKTVRVLMLPYQGGDNELYMLRYAYFFVDEARWVLGNELIETEDQ